MEFCIEMTLIMTLDILDFTLSTNWRIFFGKNLKEFKCQLELKSLCDFYPNWQVLIEC